MLVSEYNYIFVVVLFVVVIFVFYIVLNMVGCVVGSVWLNVRIWLMGGGFVLGVGIWVMYFVGMLVMDYVMNMCFDLFFIGFFMLIVIGFFLFVLWLVSVEKLCLCCLLLGVLVMGLGISVMYYIGMVVL